MKLIKSDWPKVGKNEDINSNGSCRMAVEVNK